MLWYLYNLHLQLDATLLTLHLQLDATLLNLHSQLDATLLNLHIQLDATLLHLHIELDATLLTLHLQLDATLLTLHLQLEAVFLQVKSFTSKCHPVYPNVSNIAGTQMIDRSWQNLKTFLGSHLCLKHKQRGCSRRHPHIAQNIYMWVWRQSLGPVKPKTFLQQLEKLLWPTKVKKQTGQIRCVKSSSTKNRHLAEAKHDFCAFLLVNRPAIAKMIMAMLTHCKSVV